MTTVPHDLVQPLLVDYLLGDLGAAERRQVSVHLDECADCAAELRELEATFQGIGHTVAPVTPPAHLRNRVLKSLTQQPRGGAAAGSAPPMSLRRSPALLALAATLAVVFGGLLLFSLQRAERLESDLQRTRAEAAMLSSRIAETSVQADLAVSILTANDMRRIDLAGQEASRTATARGYWSASHGLLIVADQLPTPPPGREYQVWLIGSGSAGPVSAGLLGDAQAGRGMLIVPSPPGVTGGGLTIAITDEPEGGLPAPTGAKHLVGSL